MDRKREQQCQLPEAAYPDEVEQAGLDSFPASDPPSWVVVHSGRPPAPATSASVDSSVSPHAAPGADALAGRDCEATTVDPDPHRPDHDHPEPSRQR